ncbi:hypothetical protein [Paenibacillus sp. 1781tsa1]|uniref:hypothetical protein n=1 Tax=Paenibacillus sp. 1781tsa1 TaxID=2953810 RepID=UPI00209E0C48|nr:hypothetical protein [Paenibacillus sp. 1781tsa1]MCP1185056.1 hypothetical protein [Paenibacillus sp. 1781tsa1]
MKTYSITQNKIFDIMKVEDRNPAKLFKRLKETGAAPCCKRCGGSGRYSYNLKDGSICYGCGGAGVIIENEKQLLEVVSSKVIQDKLETYLNELALKKTKKSEPIVETVVKFEEPENPEDYLMKHYNDAIERMDWEFVVRIMTIMKNKGAQSEGKLATEKQISYIKSLVKRKKPNIQSDMDNLQQLITDFEEDRKNITHAEVNYIINWLTEK